MLANRDCFGQEIDSVAVYDSKAVMFCRERRHVGLNEIETIHSHDIEPCGEPCVTGRIAAVWALAFE